MAGLERHGLETCGALVELLLWCCRDWAGYRYVCRVEVHLSSIYWDLQSRRKSGNVYCVPEMTMTELKCTSRQCAAGTGYVGCVAGVARLSWQVVVYNV